MFKSTQKIKSTPESHPPNPKHRSSIFHLWILLWSILRCQFFCRQLFFVNSWFVFSFWGVGPGPKRALTRDGYLRSRPEPQGAQRSPDWALPRNPLSKCIYFRQRLNLRHRKLRQDASQKRHSELIKILKTAPNVGAVRQMAANEG